MKRGFFFAVGSLCALWCGGCGEVGEVVEGEGEQIECLVGEEGEDDDAVLVVGELGAEARCFVVRGSIGDDDDEEDVFRFTIPADMEARVGFMIQLDDDDAEVKLEFEDNDSLELTLDCEDDDPMFSCSRSFDKGEFDVTVNAEDEEANYTLQVVLLE